MEEEEEEEEDKMEFECLLTLRTRPLHQPRH
jgi:hypothetical protein